MGVRTGNLAFSRDFPTPPPQRQNHRAGAGLPVPWGVPGPFARGARLQRSHEPESIFGRRLHAALSCGLARLPPRRPLRRGSTSPSLGPGPSTCATREPRVNARVSRRCGHRRPKTPYAFDEGTPCAEAGVVLRCGASRRGRVFLGVLAVPSVQARDCEAFVVIATTDANLRASRSRMFAGACSCCDSRSRRRCSRGTDMRQPAACAAS